MSKLAINGGEPIRKEYFPEYRTIGKEEISAVNKVMETGVLSRYFGSFDYNFMGGPKVKELEDKLKDFYKVKYALLVNSCTSGLYAAVGALQLEPGDEIIVSPYTMTASATAAFVFNHIPVFADIDPDNFCISPKSIREKITNRTRAILLPQIFGNSADMDEILEIAKEFNLYIIEDCAQVPFGKYKDKLSGTIGDIGVFSFNYHKHIHTGEGGFILTNNEELYNKMALIRNHGEVVIQNEDAIKQFKLSSISNILGFNFRMCEIEAAIGLEQIKKVEYLIDERINNCNYLTSKLKDIKGIIPPYHHDYVKHNYYVYAIKYESENFGGLERNKFAEAVKAELKPTISREDEGVLMGVGYVKPLYFLPLYQNKKLFGNSNIPWCFNENNISYEKGLAKVCEEMHYKKLITTELMTPGMSKEDLDDVINAFYKVAENYKELL